jgi:hypothetical protein
MKDKCRAQFDGIECQRSAGHSGTHQNHGTDDEPVFIHWSDLGVEELKKETAQAQKFFESKI